MKNALDVLQKHNSTIPRYTSYPTAPHLQQGSGPQRMEELLHAAPNQGGCSLYLHIPFCDRLCWFCGCHTKHTLKYEPISQYVGFLCEEMKLVAGKADGPIPVSQIHFGGGSPSMLQSGDAKKLAKTLREQFDIAKNAEVSIEIDPSDVSDDTIEGFCALGMTRASVGVQDFDKNVQAAINRTQSFEQSKAVINKLRQAGITSLNIDMLYGLPHQTLETVSQTVDKVLDLKPDRIALFGYAHVPWMKKHQKMIPEKALPNIAERYEQANVASQLLVKAGYQKIGFDHFALPDDSLAVAARSGNLRRNFQGYTTDACETLIGLGGSSISQSGSCLVQNVVPTKQYQDMISRGELPAMRAITLSLDDKIRGFIIERLMCDFAINFDDLSHRFGDLARPYIAEAKLYANNDEDGLCRLADNKLVIEDEAKTFVRIVASWFDAYLAKTKFKYSMAV